MLSKISFPKQVELVLQTLLEAHMAIPLRWDSSEGCACMKLPWDLWDASSLAHAAGARGGFVPPFVSKAMNAAGAEGDLPSKVQELLAGGQHCGCSAVTWPHGYELL